MSGQVGGSPIGVPDFDGRWWSCRVLHTHFTTAGLSQVLDLNAIFTTNPFPTDVFFLNFGHVVLRQVFAAPSLTTATIILGVTTDTNGFLEATQVQTGQSLGRKAIGGTFDESTNAYQSAMAPLLEMTNVGANVNTFTQGILDVYIPYVRPPA